VALILSGALLLFVAWLHPPNVVPFVALLAAVSVIFLLQTREAVAQYATALWRATSRGFAGLRASDPVVADPVVADPDGERPVDGWLERLAPGTSPAEQEEARMALRTSTPRLDDSTLAAAVQVQIASARSLLAAERDLSDAWPLLATSLHEELARVQANLFSLLCCSRDAAGAPMADILLDAEARITNGVADDRANAIELLDVTLPKWLKRPVVALTEDHGPLQTLRRLGPGPVPAPLTARERLALMADDASLQSWTLGLVRRGLVRLGDNEKGGGMPDVGSSDTYPPEVASVLWLRSIDIFGRVPYQLLSELASRLRPYPVSAGVRIVTEGEEGEELYIVRSGEVAVQHGDDVVARVGAGSVFGELAVLDPAPRSADVVATTDTDLLILDRTTLLDLMGRRPEVAADIITMLVRRLRERAPEA
jgi:CRP/FNR family transcriptional regulator, cyclic AMP receptor protein